jgi:hypothetical protein
VKKRGTPVIFQIPKVVMFGEDKFLGYFQCPEFYIDA